LCHHRCRGVVFPDRGHGGIIFHGEGDIDDDRLS